MGGITDKIMSTRIDESVIQHIGMLAKKLGTSKKAVLENAVRCYQALSNAWSDWSAGKAKKTALFFLVQSLGWNAFSFVRPRKMTGK